MTTNMMHAMADVPYLFRGSSIEQLYTLPKKKVNLVEQSNRLGIPKRKYVEFARRGNFRRALAPRTQVNQQSSAGVVLVSTPCGVVSTRATTVVVPGMLGF